MRWSDMLKEKNHTTVIITEAMLREMGACQDGIDQVSQWLPATISTDPLENLDLAVEIASVSLVWRLYWMLRMAAPNVAVDYDLGLDEDYFGKWRHATVDLEEIGHNEDVLLAMQYLAWIADFIATKEGR